jgi:hypothetical protein
MQHTVCVSVLRETNYVVSVRSSDQLGPASAVSLFVFVSTSNRRQFVAPSRVTTYPSIADIFAVAFSFSIIELKVIFAVADDVKI